MPLLVLAEIAKQAKSAFFENECRVAGMEPRGLLDVALCPVEADAHSVQFGEPAVFPAAGRSGSLSRRFPNANGLPKD
jgi:hypothetical protein